ncbi:MAG TPA: HIT domain-containing protein [Rectinemataceae bacterium]
MEYFFSFEKMGYLKGAKPSGCILCLIKDGSPDVDSLIVYESSRTLVSLNLYPYNPGHLILFPKRHVLDVRGLVAEEKADMDSLVDVCLDVLDSSFSPQGYNIGYNQGLAAGGSIEHLHLHIIPRYRNELGIADLIGGKKVLVQDPRDTRDILSKAFEVYGKDHEKS